MPVRTGGGFPPYAGHAHPSAALVTGLLIAAVVTGATGVALCWLALRRGWRPPVRRLVIVGSFVAIALTFLPHIGSADPESYAAYGREAAIGVDPYHADPTATLTARHDPYAGIVEAPWQHTSSVYGPLATWEQDAATRVAGDDPRTAVWLLNLVGAIAFALTSLLLLTVVRNQARDRVAVLWAANPLLLWQLVAGAHVDTLEIALAVAAVVAVRRSALLAGVLMGAAIIVKLPAGLVAAGLAWTLRRAPRRLAVFVTAGVAVVAAAYLTAGSHALDQARAASKYTSRATPWRPLATLLDHAWGRSTSREFIGAVALVIAAGVVVVLARGVRGEVLVVPPALLVLAYVLVTPYALPWYDGLAWALVVLVAASRLDLVLLAHTAALSLAYIPGRAVPLPSAVGSLTSALRDVVAPIVLGVLVAIACVLSRRRLAAHPG